MRDTTSTPREQKIKRSREIARSIVGKKIGEINDE